MRCVVLCSVTDQADVSGHQDLLAAPPSGLAESVLDNESLSERSDGSFFETDLEDVVGFRR
jgi:hypothetical protein